MCVFYCVRIYNFDQKDYFNNRNNEKLVKELDKEILFS
jgi:hypothetical protein